MSTQQYVTIWRDPESSRNGLLTYADRSTLATRNHDEVSRAVPEVRVLDDTESDREFLEQWLRQPAPSTLAVPEPLVRDILGWELPT